MCFICPSIFCCQRSRLLQQSVNLKVYELLIIGHGCTPIHTDKKQKLCLYYPCLSMSIRGLTSFLVGPGGIEPPTSPLSGVRSSHLSYGPMADFCHWWSWSGSNRRPPECKSGALPAELQPRLIFRGRLDTATSEYYPEISSETAELQVEIRTRLSARSEKLAEVYGVERLPTPEC